MESLLPSDPFTLALKYLGDRELSCGPFLADRTAGYHEPWALVAANSNGKKKLDFHVGPELGAEVGGIIQSLISACRLHDIEIRTRTWLMYYSG
jgi:hypothetical protein